MRPGEQGGPAGPGGRSFVLGIGTGRCGIRSLADLLNRQRDTHVTLAEPPLLEWHPVPGRPGIGERLRRIGTTRDRRIVGDVAWFYLPYIEEAIASEPNVRVICLERPREEVVASFSRWLDAAPPLPTDHWSSRPAPGWHQDPIWTRTFPQYEIRDREEGIRRYWEDYHRTVDELARRFPENVRVFPMRETLGSESGVRRLLTFAGIPEGGQLVPGAVAGATSPLERHPRRLELESAGPSDPRRCVVLVLHTGHILPACEEALRALERRGYAVWRAGGYAAVDQGRSQLATDALTEGFEETLWVDADIGFDPDAVERLRAHGEPLVCGIYPQKGRRALSCHVMPGTKSLLFGEGGGLTEILYAAGGFLLVRRQVYMDIQRRLELPVCNERFGRPLIPFFLPMPRPHDEGSWYLAEDYAFCERARRCGYRVHADTTIRLWHFGTHAYGWESAGIDPSRFSTFNIKLE